MKKEAKKIVSIKREVKRYMLLNGQEKPVFRWIISYEDGTKAYKITKEITKHELDFLDKGMTDQKESFALDVLIRRRSELQMEEIPYLCRQTKAFVDWKEKEDIYSLCDYHVGEVILDGRVVYSVWARDKDVVIDNVWRFLKELRYQE